MTQTEALRLALEALEKTQAALAQCFGSHKAEEGDRHRALSYSRTTITAIKATLEAKGEPVAWGYRDRNGEITDCITPHEHDRAEGDYRIPLYSIPSQRTWVGLTKEDKESFWTADQMTQEEWDEFYQAVEAKLKEKNT